jgi:hypothetical protein
MPLLIKDELIVLLKMASREIDLLIGISEINGIG